MTIQEAHEYLKSKGVPADQILVGTLGSGEQYGIEPAPVNGKWIVYYSERGSKTPQKSFATEAEAAQVWVDAVLSSR